MSVVIAVYARQSGALVFEDRIHMLPPGHTAIGEAITVYGLERIRIFSPEAQEEAMHYAARLQREVQDEAPLIF